MAIDFDTNPADCANALLRLSTIGYSEPAVRSRLGLGELNDLQLRAAPIYRQQRLVEREPLDSAIDVFLLQGTLPAAAIDDLMPTSGKPVAISAKQQADMAAILSTSTDCIGELMRVRQQATQANGVE